MTTITTVADDAREATAAQAGRINEAYSLAGARRSAEEAARVGQVSLSEFDLAEMQKVTGLQTREQILTRLQQQEEAAAARRVEALKADEARRSAIIGGLAWTGPIDVTDTTDLAGLPDEVARHLPWHLRNTGPAGNRTTFVRSEWSAEEMLEAARVARWNVHKARIEWSEHGGRWSARNKYVIVRDPIPAYAADCTCSGYHGRRRERRNHPGGTPKDPCPWTVPWDLGICREDWKADLQMEDLVDVLATFTEDGRVRPSSVLWLSGGERVCIQLRLVDTAYTSVLGGLDPWEVYLGIHQNYTGQGACRMNFSGVRVGCDNARKWSDRLATSVAKIPHVGDMKAKLRLAGEQILLAEGFMREEQRIAEELAAIELSTAGLGVIAAEFVPYTTEAPRQLAAQQTRRADFLAHLLGDETIPGELRRTGYGVREAVNRWYANLAPSAARSDTARLNSVWEPDGPAHQATRKAQRMVLELGGKRVKQRKR